MDNFMIITLLAILMALVFRLCFCFDEKINKLKLMVYECASKRAVEIIIEDSTKRNEQVDSEVESLKERISKCEQTKYVLEVLKSDVKDEEQNDESIL